MPRKGHFCFMIALTPEQSGTLLPYLAPSDGGFI